MPEAYSGQTENGIEAYRKIWEAAGFMPEVDEEHCLLTSPFPVCPDCSGIARPNILMFGDWHWLDRRTEQQMKRLHEWIDTVKRPVVMEIGAGNAVPTVRLFGQSLRAPLIRINPTDADVIRPGDVSLNTGALNSITAITGRLHETGFF